MAQKHQRTTPSTIVAYLRTSTKDQLLSIDGQRAIIQRIAMDKRCDIVRWCTEHESGGDNDRPELAKALHHARGTNSILCVAKLDRLARDQTFLMSLFDGNVPIIFGDLPAVDGSPASRMTVQSMAMIAEFERLRMGERMADWHKQRKRLGFKAGTPANLTYKDQVKGAKAAAVAQDQASRRKRNVAGRRDRLGEEGRGLEARGDCQASQRRGLCHQAGRRPSMTSRLSGCSKGSAQGPESWFWSRVRPPRTKA